MDMVKFHAASACLILVCLLMNLQPLLADGDAVETASTDSAAAEISAKLKQSEDRDEVARLKAELSGLKSKESNFAEQSAKLSSQLLDAKKQAESAAAEAQQAIKAKDAAERELAKCKYLDFFQ